jgi:hypothetical protein
MVTITTLGAARPRASGRGPPLAFSKGIWTCMITTSGFSSRARATAPWSLVVSPTTSRPP